MYAWSLEVGNDAGWDAFVAGHPAGHFLQSAAWGRLRAEQGWEVRRIIVRKQSESGEHFSLGGEFASGGRLSSGSGYGSGFPGRETGGGIVAGAQILVQGRRGMRRAYLPRGPVARVEDPAWPALLDGLRRVSRDCVLLRVEPNWGDGEGGDRILEAAGLIESAPAQPPSTLRLDLGLAEDRLLAEMKQKWRYNIRLAERKGVQVGREGAKGAEVLARLIRETAERNGFAARTADYYRAVWRSFDDSNQARLYVARHEGAALAAILVIHHGDTATYLYGGSSELERQRMPNHALQWAAIRGALAEGLRHYDFWGIPDAIGQAMGRGEAPESVPEGADDLWGVWGFKRGFGGEVWRAAGAWDMVHAPLRYRLAMRLGSRGA